MNRKNTILDLIQEGDIILVSNNNKSDQIARGIKWMTNSRFNHAAMVVNYKNIRHLTIFGCVEDKISRFMSKKYSICVMRYPGLTYSQQLGLKQLSAYDTRVKLGYDFPAYRGYILFNLLAKIGIDIKWIDNPWDKRPDRVCSSSIIQRWYAMSGIELCPHRGEENVTPGDIYVCNELKVVYEEL